MTDAVVELQAPDISRWQRGNTGVDWVHRFEAGQPGPQVMVQALTHGNEICGAIALDWLLNLGFRPQRGTLVVAFANVEAYLSFDPADPFPSRCVDEDFNRVWADDQLFGTRDSVELRRARELQPFVDAADMLLDIHSMGEACRPLMVCGTVDKNAQFARELGVPADLLIDTGHPAGLRMVERGGFGLGAAPRAAAAAAGAAPGARHRGGGREVGGLPLPAADRGAGSDRQGRHADRARRRSGLGHAVRPLRAGDARHAQPEAGRHGGAPGTLRKLSPQAR
jgi:hypothetical protein